MAKRISHLLVLIDRKPREGEAAFVEGMLQWLFVDGQQYVRFVDGQTRIRIVIVGPHDFNEAYIANAALIHFRANWGLTPDLSEIRYQKFNGPKGNGATIEQWTSDASTLQHTSPTSGQVKRPWWKFW